MKPLFKWAGGKTRMIKKYAQTPGIPVSGYDTYCEPFLGGGAMFIWLSHLKDIKFVLGDIKTEIIDIYKEIQQRPDTFLKSCQILEKEYLKTTDKRSFYYDIRDKYILEPYNPSTLYFLMKTSFNGVWQSSKIANGKFYTPAGLLNETKPFIDEKNIWEWQEVLTRTTLYAGSWQETVKLCDKDTFYFMDPPYRNVVRTQYGETFTDKDQLELLDFCKKQKLSFFCNQDSPDGFWDVNKGNMKMKTYNHTYSVGSGANKLKPIEILLYNE